MDRWTRLGVVVGLLALVLAGLMVWVNRAGDHARLLKRSRQVAQWATAGEMERVKTVCGEDFLARLEEHGGWDRMRAAWARVEWAEHGTYEFVRLTQLDLREGRAAAAYRRRVGGTVRQEFEVHWKRTGGKWEVSGETYDMVRKSSPEAAEVLGG
jgi:hypothetical protein